MRTGFCKEKRFAHDEEEGEEVVKVFQQTPWKKKKKDELGYKDNEWIACKRKRVRERKRVCERVNECVKEISCVFFELKGFFSLKEKK